MRNELDTTMALMGVTRVADINRNTIVNWQTCQPYEKLGRVL
jgi:isopentenyl diphosphate isomerase/L-lactate dehydrogenase-like FMN-dependent dehydrogenase